MSQDYFLRPKSSRFEKLTVAEVQLGITTEFPCSQFGEGEDQGICLVYRDDEHLADLWMSDDHEKSLVWNGQAESSVEWISVMGGNQAGDVADALIKRLDLKDVTTFDEDTIPNPPAVLKSKPKDGRIATKWGSFALDRGSVPIRWVCPNVACSPNCFGLISIREESGEDFQKTLSERVDLLGEAFEKELEFRPEVMRQSAAEMKNMYGKLMLGMNLVGIAIAADVIDSLVLYYNLSYAEESGPSFYEVEVVISDNEVEYVGIMLQEPDSCGNCHLFTPSYIASALKRLKLSKP